MPVTGLPKRVEQLTKRSRSVSPCGFSCTPGLLQDNGVDSLELTVDARNPKDARRVYLAEKVEMIICCVSEANQFSLNRVKSTPAARPVLFFSARRLSWLLSRLLGRGQEAELSYLARA